MPEEKMSKAERDQARARIEKYHQRILGELMEPAFKKILEFKNGKISAFEADYAMQIYHEQSKELFGFINYYYPKNAMLTYLLEIIDQEERGEWKWEPTKKFEEYIAPIK